MLRGRPDRDLRRLVAELAATSAEDLEAILSGLDPAQRQQVGGLLADYSGAPEAAESLPPPPAPKPPPRLSGLSPWLAARLRQAGRLDAAHASRPAGQPDAGGRLPGNVVAMTPTALRTLRACAETLEAERRPPDRPDAAAGGLLGKVRGAMAGRRKRP